MYFVYYYTYLQLSLRYAGVFPGVNLFFRSPLPPICYNRFR